MKTHRIAIAGILVFLFIEAVPSFALQYSITDLGLYSSPDHDFFGGSPLVSYKINNNNQIAGYSSEGAFFWEEGNISNLGNANIGGINDNGAVAGNDLEGIFIWENGVKRYVRSREHVLLDQVVLDINNSNQIALSERPIAERGLYIYAYLWDDMNRTTVRIDNSPYSLDSMATSVNDAGRTTVLFQNNDSFLWENGVLTRRQRICRFALGHQQQRTDCRRYRQSRNC
ncbi:MAG: hypothetical protein R2941_10995 [Desulfobacterales bacterium]